MHRIMLFRTARGECLVLAFLEKLEKGFKAKVDGCIRYLEQYGDKAKRPKASFLRDKIYELRVSYKHLELRMLYFFDKEIIMLTHAFFKKTDEVPAAEIEKAIGMRAEYFRNK